MIGYHAYDEAKYLGDPCPVPSLNSTVAQILIRKSPRSAWHKHPKLNPDYQREDSEKFDLGIAAHGLLLEGVEKITLAPAQYTDWRTKEARALRDVARAAGTIPMLAHQYEEVRTMVKVAANFLEDCEISHDIADADNELTGIALEGKTYLRCRFDAISKSRRLIMDYKTTEDASPQAFARQIVRMNYHFQARFYCRIAAMLGAQSPRFVFLAQSTEPPHECSLHELTPELQEIGDLEVAQAISLWRKCIEANEWPSYGTGVHPVEPTAWQLQEHGAFLLGHQT